MTPIEMVDAGIRALRQAEAGRLSHEAGAQTALAWAALAQATSMAQDTDDAPQREAQLDALVDHGPDQPDAPRIGFRSIREEV